MPIYRYETIEPDGREGDVFEVEQSINSPVLERHPENGKPVRRVYCGVNINEKYTEGREKALLDTARIKRAGFEILERDKISGKYFKR